MVCLAALPGNGPFPALFALFQSVLERPGSTWEIQDRYQAQEKGLSPSDILLKPQDILNPHLRHPNLIATIPLTAPIVGVCVDLLRDGQNIGPGFV